MKCECAGLVKEAAADKAFDEDMYDCVTCGHMIGEHGSDGTCGHGEYEQWVDAQLKLATSALAKLKDKLTPHDSSAQHCVRLAEHGIQEAHRHLRRNDLKEAHDDVVTVAALIRFGGNYIGRG